MRNDSIDIDCKTVGIFAYSRTCEQSTKRSATRLKTESETEERRVFLLSPRTPYGRVLLARFARVRLLRHALPISLLILKKPTVLQSSIDRIILPFFFSLLLDSRLSLSQFTDGILLLRLERSIPYYTPHIRPQPGPDLPYQAPTYHIRPHVY